MNNKPYYFAYEERYQRVYSAGVDFWGHNPNDEELTKVLTNWVNEHQLAGKKVIEFACGEGAAGVILSRLGCIYHGVDISPTAVEKAKSILAPFPNAIVELCDMVNQAIDSKYDAALDIMGLHMLVLDQDRRRYLQNAFNCLKSNAPMLFYRESFRVDAFEGEITTFEEWVSITKSDYVTPAKRVVQNGDKEIEVFIPLVPARAKTKAGYINELTAAGFVVQHFQEMDYNEQNPFSATLYVYKP